MAMIGLIGVSLLALFILSSWSPVSGNLAVEPRDVVVALGQKVQLNCSTDDEYGVNWWHVPVGSTSNEDVFISSVVVLPYHPRLYRIQRNEVGNRIQDYNLVISSVTREDAGKYTCIDRAGHGEQRSAELVVIESDPKCHSNIDGKGFVGDNDCEKPPDEISCLCRLHYFGNMPPAVEWTNSAGQVIEPRPPVDTSQKYIVSSNLTMKPHLAMNGTYIVWRAERLKSSNWTSAEVKVKYAMKTNRTVSVTHGESIVCSANSSEICNYRWTMQNGTIVSETANLTIVDTGTYFCDATCPLYHGECTVRSMVADYKKIHEDNTENGSNKMTLIAMIVVILTVSLSVALIAVFYYLRMKRMKKNISIGLPYDDELHLQNQLKTKDRMVVGVAILDKLMYVAHHSLNVISVYATVPPIKLTKEIEMEGLGEPCDMAACPLSRCLYITDSKNKCVWKLQAPDGKATVWMDKTDEPFTISVCSNGNVLMVQQPNTVVEYNAEGYVVEKCNVEYLPRIEDIQHAVENEQGHFIVSHGGKRDKVHAVCEVTKDGGLLRSFGSDPGDGARQLSNPRHVAVDDQDRVYVVYAFNDRVLQLDKTFQAVLNLPCAARSQPLRLAIHDGQVLLGKYGAVDIFSACDKRRSEKNGEYSAVPMNN